jgi:hypothetical protein
MLVLLRLKDGNMYATWIEERYAWFLMNVGGSQIFNAHHIVLALATSVFYRALKRCKIMSAQNEEELTL